MSYGTCKRAQKRYKCPVCGCWDWHSPIEQELHRVSVGSKNRYLCAGCFADRREPTENEAAQAGEGAME